MKVKMATNGVVKPSKADNTTHLLCAIIERTVVTGSELGKYIVHFILYNINITESNHCNQETILNSVNWG